MTPREQVWAYRNFPAFLRRLLATRSTMQVAMRAGVDKTTILRAARGSATHLSTAKAVIDAYGEW